MLWDFSVVSANLRPILVSFWVTIALSLLVILLGTILGTILGVASVARAVTPRVVSRLFTELFLALPVLVILLWLYYSLPLLFPALVFGGFAVAVVGLSVSLSAFVSEIVRAGINSISAGELEAAYCTGMTKMQAVRYILLPQVVRRSWPPLMGQYITTYKFSTLASVIAVPELLHTSNTIIVQTYRPLEVYTAVALLFLVTVWPLNAILRRIQRVAEWGGTGKL